MKFSPESRERIYCEYVNHNHDFNQKRSISTIAFVSDSELLNILIEMIFNINSTGGYALSLTIYK